MRAKLHLVLSISIFFSWFSTNAQSSYWKSQQLEKQEVKRAKEQLQVNKLQLFRLNASLFREKLSQATLQKHVMLDFPDVNGGSVSYKVKQTSVLHPDLAKKYPNIQSFSGISLDGQKRIARKA